MNCIPSRQIRVLSFHWRAGFPCLRRSFVDSSSISLFAAMFLFPLQHNGLPVQSLSCVWLFATPWTVAKPDFLILHHLPEFALEMSIESMMPSNHLILRCLWWMVEDNLKRRDFIPLIFKEGMNQRNNRIVLLLGYPKTLVSESLSGDPKLRQGTLFPLFC